LTFHFRADRIAKSPFFKNFHRRNSVQIFLWSQKYATKMDGTTTANRNVMCSGIQ